MKLLSLALIAPLVTSCVVSHSRSTIADEKTAYAISKQQAANIVESSMRGFISPDYFTGKTADGLTHTGYYRMMLDTTTITGSAIPVTGTDSSGKAYAGYGFTVTDAGTILGLKMPEQIYSAMKSRAAADGKSISVQ